MDLLIDRSSVKQRLRGALAGKRIPPVYRGDMAGAGLLEDFGRFVAAHHMGLSAIAIGEDIPDSLGIEHWLDRSRALAAGDLTRMALYPPDNVTWREYHPLAAGFVLGSLRLGVHGLQVQGGFTRAKAAGAATTFVEDPMPEGLWPRILDGLHAVPADGAEGAVLLKDAVALIEMFRLADAQLHAGDSGQG